MKTERIDDLVVLPRRVVPQPTPELNVGGDCGACVLAGLTDLSVADVYAKLREDGKVISFSQYTMASAIRAGRYAKPRLFSRIIEDAPSWRVHEILRQFGDAGWMQSMPWFQYLTMAFESGYYAIACVRHDKTGPMSGGTDHWVLLVGSRVRWELNEDGTGRGSYEVLVSCSSRSTPDEEWVEAGQFLKERGGFNCLLARPV